MQSWYTYYTIIKSLQNTNSNVTSGVRFTKKASSKKATVAKKVTVNKPKKVAVKKNTINKQKLAKSKAKK